MFRRRARGTRSGRRGVPRSSVPKRPYIINLNTLLQDIYLRFIALNDEDFERYYRVVESIFQQIHDKMKKVNLFYARNSSTIQYAGSHPDHLRINKPNEFDIDIVIGLPLNMAEDPLDPENSDFLIEAKDPGFIQLRMGIQYDRLPRRFRHTWQEQAPAYRWKGRKNYLLRPKFMDWFQGVVNSALNKFRDEEIDKPVFIVDGNEYAIRRSESGPAMTLYVESLHPAKKLKLDVDLVPALRFPIDRFPVGAGYRQVRPGTHCGSDYFMAVPKPNKCGRTEYDTDRSWRLAMHQQERILMHDTKNMRQAIRLMKKFRDAQNMDKIASYYINTIFFWEAVERQNDKTFWNQSPAYLFEYMLSNFYYYLIQRNLPYFWHRRNNLLHGIDRRILRGYAKKVKKLLKILARPDKYREVARLLLTKREFQKYKPLLYSY